MILKEKGLLEVEPPLVNLGETPVRSVDGKYFEQLIRLLEVAAMISDQKSNPFPTEKDNSISQNKFPLKKKKQSKKLL